MSLYIKTVRSNLCKMTVQSGVRLTPKEIIDKLNRGDAVWNEELGMIAITKDQGDNTRWVVLATTELHADDDEEGHFSLEEI
jgi:hypothetical protein